MKVFLVFGSYDNLSDNPNDIQMTQGIVGTLGGPTVLQPGCGVVSPRNGQSGIATSVGLAALGFRHRTKVVSQYLDAIIQ